MFVVAEKHSFAPDPERCWFSALCDYSGDVFSWQLHLQSNSALIQLPNGTEQASFTISIRPSFGIRNWQELSGHHIELSPELLSCVFQLHYGQSAQWEDLVSLELRFGQISKTQIEVWAVGRGCVQALTDEFPDGEVDFEIHTWVVFRGVAINVPLNVSDPMAYSETRIKAMIPNFAYSMPQVRQTRDGDGIVRATEVLFSPQ